jgi:hypothetical protein
MRTLLAALMLAGSMNAFASSRAPASTLPEPPPIPDSCPCSHPAFVPLSERARVVQAFWEARSKKRAASVASTIVVLGSLLGGSVANPTLNEAADQQGRADAAYERARDAALAAGGIRVERRGEDERVYVLLRKNVDYAIPGAR